MKNIVQVVHEGQHSGVRYAFEVPLDVKLEKCDVVRVKTVCSDKIAYCVTNSVMMSDEMIDMMMCGKKVTGKVLGKFEYTPFDEMKGTVKR